MHVCISFLNYALCYIDNGYQSTLGRAMIRLFFRKCWVCSLVEIKDIVCTFLSYITILTFCPTSRFLTPLPPAINHRPYFAETVSSQVRPEDRATASTYSRQWAAESRQHRQRFSDDSSMCHSRHQGATRGCSHIEAGSVAY